MNDLERETAPERAKEMMSVARSKLTLTNPFFAHLALGMKLVQDPMLPVSSATDGYRLIYNPNLIAQMKPEDVLTGVAHECLHVAFAHLHRKGNRDHEAWNVAGDYAINPILKKNRFPLLDTDLYDEKYEGMSADEIYEKLPKSKKGKQGSCCSAGHGKGKPCGGMLEPKTKDGQPIKTKEQMEQFVQDMKLAVVKAADAAKMQGNLPGFAKDLVDSITDPKLPWQELLRSFVELNSKSDYNWSIPNRRYLQSGWHLPSLNELTIGVGTLAVDTSGSMSKKDLEEAFAELSGILTRCNIEGLHVLQCDTKVENYTYLTTDDMPLKAVTVHGRGGTSFKHPFDYLEKEGLETSFLVYCTDGYADSYADPPEYPVMWILSSAGRKDFNPPYGDVIQLD